MALHWLRLIACVLIGVIYIASEFGDIFVKRYDRRLMNTLRPPVAKYKIIDDSK